MKSTEGLQSALKDERSKVQQLKRELYNIAQFQGLFNPHWGKSDDEIFSQDFGIGDEPCDRAIANKPNYALQDAIAFRHQYIKVLEADLLRHSFDMPKIPEVEKIRAKFFQIEGDHRDLIRQKTEELFQWKHPGFHAKATLSTAALKTCWWAEDHGV